MRTVLKVAAIQMSSEIGCVEKNVAKGKRFVEQAVEQGAAIVCLPELFNTGYFSHTDHVDTAYFKWAEPIDGDTVSAFRQTAKQLGVHIIVPFYEYDRPGVYYNSACLINGQGHVEGVYRKTHVPWSLTGWEKFYIRPGYAFPVFDTPHGKIGIMICYDRDFPEVARTLALKGAETIFVPNGSSKGLTEIWQNMMQVRAYENQVYMVGACLTGRTDEEHHEFSGHSLVTNPFGAIENKLGLEEGIVMADIDPNQIRRARERRFLYRDRRPEMYQKLTEY